MKKGEGKIRCYLFLLFVCYLLLLEKSHFWLDSDLRGRSARRGAPTSLGTLFLAFFFGLLRSLSPKFRIFCDLFLVFLSTSFLLSNMQASVLQDKGNNQMRNPGALVLGFLPYLFRAFLTTCWRTSPSLEIEKSAGSARSSGPQATRHSSISETRNSLLPFFTMTKRRSPRLASTVQPCTDWHFLSPVPLGLWQECP